MKRKLALLLAFVMMFTMLPMMSVGAVSLAGGGVPSIPAGDADDMIGILVASNEVANGFQPGVPAVGVTDWRTAISGLHASSRHVPEAVRSLRFDAVNFPVGADGHGFYQARVIFDGLDDSKGDTIVSARNPFASWSSNNVASAEALFTDLPPRFASRFNAQWRNGTTGVNADYEAAGGNNALNIPLSNEILSIATASQNPTMTVVLQRDLTRLDVGVITVWVTNFEADGVTPSQNAIPPSFGVSLDVAFLSFTDSDVVANFTWDSGVLSSLPSRIPIANRVSDDFTFSLSDDPTMFNTRTRIPAIQIREPVGLGFTAATYDVRLTLERGFAWDNRHNASGANTNVIVDTEIGGALGLNTIVDSPIPAVATARLVTRTAPARSTVYYQSALDVNGPVNNEPRREMVVSNITLAGDPLDTPPTGFASATRFRDSLLIGDGDMAFLNAQPDGFLWVTATDNARYGQVRAFVELGTNLGANNENVISDGWVTIAEYTDAQVLFYRDEDEDLQDYIRMSGAQQWQQANSNNTPLGDDVLADSVVEDYHETAWVVLTETVRGVLPFTGLRDINFEFPEGAQILGVRWETNEGHFIDSQDDNSNDEWYFDGRRRDGALDTLINRNTVTMRPEIGRNRGREEVAQIRLQFLVSIEPEFEAKYGEELWVVASGPGFDDGVRAQVAIVRDPITVQTSRVTVGDGDIVAAGMFRHINIDPIYVHETDLGALEWNQTVQIFVEENTFQDTITANAIILRADTVETDGESGLEVGRPINIGRGTSVPISRTSRDEPGWIRFSDIQITGLVLPGHEYDITVVGSAVAANHWTFAGGWGGITGQIAHGFWSDEPYKSPAFGFDGTDSLSPGNVPPPPAIQPPTTPPTSGMGPTTLFQSSAYTIRQGPQAGMAISPSFRMVTFGNGQNASAFIAAAAIGDILGWTNEWNAATNEGTFYLPDGRVVVFRNGSNQVTINGEARVMTNADGSPANAHIFNDRFMVHIRFFEQLGVNITWLGGTPGNNSMIVTP